MPKKKKERKITLKKGQELKKESKVTFKKIEELVRLKSNDQLKSIIRKAKSSVLTDNRGMTLLHLAAKYNNADFVKFLTEIGYNLNVKNIYGTTPLFMAASCNSSEALNALLDVNADIFIPIVNDKSTLQAIFEKKSVIQTNIIVDVLKHLRKKFIDAKTTADVLLTADCPLDFVVLMKDVEVLKIILKSKDYLGQNECHRIMGCAMQTGYLENVRLLLEYGSGDYSSMTAYVNNICKMIDAPKANLTFIKLYIEHINDWNLYKHFWLIAGLSNVFEEKNMNIVRVFLDCGVDEHVRNKYDFDLTAHIFMNNNFEASELLQDRDFNANALNMNRATGLCVAAEAGLKSNIKFLLDKGADVNLTDKFGLTPMHHVRLDNCVLPLLRYGADVQIIGTQGQTVFDELNDSTTVKLAHLAMLELKGVCVKQEIRDKINANSEMKDLFEKCSLQLESMRNLQIFGNVTLFTVLFEQIKTFAYCIRSQESANIILNRCKAFGIHDYYYLILKNKLRRAAEMYDFRWKAATILSEIMGIDYPGHFVIEKIIDFLTIRDLRAFDFAFDFDA